MTDTLLIESNRSIAVADLEKHQQNITNIESDKHKSIVKNAEWSTNIDSGILLQPGDEISLESASVNIKGAGEESQFMTFIGENDDVLDNKTSVEICYYVNNNCQFNVNLPMGTASRNHSNGGYFTNCDYGSTCLTGKHLFGVNFTKLQDANEDGVSQFLGNEGTGFTSMNFYNHIDNGWLCSKGIFFNTELAMNLETGVQDGTPIAYNSSPLNTDNDEKITQCQAMGYKSWLDNTPQWALPGVQFGQAQPLPDSVNQNINNKDNGIFVRDQQVVAGVADASSNTNPPQVAPQAFVQGGANPLQILPGGLWNEKMLPNSVGFSDQGTAAQGYTNLFVKNAVQMCQHGVYQNSLAKIAFNTMPENFDDLQAGHGGDPTTADNPVFNEPIVIESCRFKGGLNTTAPNNMRFYCPEYSNEATCNLGPYYDYLTNNCIPDDAVPSDVFLDFRNNPNGERNTNYFNFLKTRIDIDVGEGNFTPTQIAKLITEQLKENTGSSSQPREDVGIVPAIYDVYNNAFIGQDGAITNYGKLQSIYKGDKSYPNHNGFNTNKGGIGVFKREIPTISNKTYKSYPTFNGFIWETIHLQLQESFEKNIDIYDQGNRDTDKYWTCTEPEMLNWKNSLAPATNSVPTSTQMGQFYSAHQAKNKYYKIMLSANPREWRSLCKMNPMVQSTPCTMATIDTGAGVDIFKRFSIYTGYAPNPISTSRNYAFVPRTLNNKQIGLQGLLTYQVGQYGCFSCLLEGGVTHFDLNNEIQQLETQAFQQDWYLGIKVLEDVSGSTTSIPPDPTDQQTFTIRQGRTSRNAVYGYLNTHAYYTPKRMSMIVTNIILDGNILAELWDKEYKELVKVNNKIYDSNLNAFRNLTESEAEQNSVESQSNTFYDNNYVEWVFGRIDDQYSSPELPSNNLQSNLTYDLIQTTNGFANAPIASRTGTARFLPNIYLTYKLYNQQPFNNSLELNFDNVGVSDLGGSLVGKVTTLPGNRNVYGSYLLTQEATGHTTLNYNDTSLINSSNSGDTGFRCQNTGYAVYNYDESSTIASHPFVPITNDASARLRAGKRNFGIPSWSTYATDFDNKFNSKLDNNNLYKHTDTKNNNPSLAYQKACKRFVKAFRYFPKIDNNGQSINYFTYDDALNERIPLPLNLRDRFTTRPSEWLKYPNGADELRAIWDKLTKFNNGNGIGMFPIFYKNDPTILASLRNAGSVPFTQAGEEESSVCMIPFMCLILQEQEREDFFPIAETGEYLSLGAGLSLSQNSLAFPATTQQTNLQKSPQAKINENISNNGQTNLNENYFQQHVGIQDCFDQTHPRSWIFDFATNPIAQAKNDIGVVPSITDCRTMLYASGGKSHANCINIGANDPVVNYDIDATRFSFQNFHTLQKQGNGVFQLGSFTPNSSPESDVVNANNTISAFSQQVNLPAGYIFKGDDFGTITGNADGINAWNCGTLYDRRTPNVDTRGVADRWSPGRCGGYGVTQKYIRVRQAQSIEGNVIKQTYPDLNSENVDIHLRPITLNKGLTDYFTSIEPGAVCRNGFTPDEARADVFGRVPYNFPLLSIGDISGNPFTLNCNHMTPYDMSQFKLRCFNSSFAIGLGGSNVLPFVNKGSFNQGSQMLNIIFLLPPTLRPYAYIEQKNIPYTASSAQSGVGITDLIVKRNDNIDIPLTSLSYKNYENTLFDKLGFQLNQLLPIYSQTQTPLVSIKYNKYLGVDKNAFDIYNNQLSPITTNGLVSTSSVLALVSGFGTANSNLTRQNPNFDLPMYNLGIINASASTSQFSEAINAFNSPKYQTYPYLVLYSNLIANCDLQVIGGSNGKQLIPALAFLSTSYSENNFIYVNRSDLIFRVTKQHTITNVKTSIHLPNGKLAESILGGDSAIIYRIDRVDRDLDGYVDYDDDDNNNNNK